jgi:hypothetical protein
MKKNVKNQPKLLLSFCILKCDKFFINTLVH